jgi:hypothetical protein
MPAFNCPRCRARTWSNDAYAGRNGWCPDCGQRVAVPAMVSAPYFDNVTRLRSQVDPAHPACFRPGLDRLALEVYQLVEARIGNLAQIEKGSYSFDCQSPNIGTGSRAVIAKLVVHQVGIPGALTGRGDEVLVWVRTTGDAESLEGQKAIRRIWNPTFQANPAYGALFVRLNPDPPHTLAASPQEDHRFAFFPIEFLPGRGVADIEGLPATAVGPGPISGAITESFDPIVELLVACSGV